MGIRDEITELDKRINTSDIEPETKKELLDMVDQLMIAATTMQWEYEGMFHSWQEHINPCVAKIRNDEVQCGEPYILDVLLKFAESAPIKDYARKRNYELDKENKMLRSFVDGGIRKGIFDFLYWDAYVNGGDYINTDAELRKGINRDIDSFFAQKYNPLL